MWHAEVKHVSYLGSFEIGYFIYATLSINQSIIHSSFVRGLPFGKESIILRVVPDDGLKVH